MVCGKEPTNAIPPLVLLEPQHPVDLAEPYRVVLGSPAEPAGFPPLQLPEPTGLCSQLQETLDH